MKAFYSLLRAAWRLGTLAMLIALTVPAAAGRIPPRAFCASLGIELGDGTGASPLSYRAACEPNGTRSNAYDCDGAPRMRC